MVCIACTLAQKLKICLLSQAEQEREKREKNDATSDSDAAVSSSEESFDEIDSADEASELHNPGRAVKCKARYDDDTISVSSAEPEDTIKVGLLSLLYLCHMAECDNLVKILIFMFYCSPSLFQFDAQLL